MIDEVVRLSCRQPAPLGRLCERLGVSERVLRSTISAARAEGYHVTVKDGFVLSRVALGPGELVTIGKAKPGRYKGAIFTDTHGGSDHFAADELYRFLKHAEREGCTFGVATGDMTDGVKPLLVPDQSHTGFDGQAKALVDVFSAAKWSLPTVAIDGNHDGYTSNAIGTVTGKLIESRMHEAGVTGWQFAGVCLGRAVIHGAHWQLWHPHGGATSRNAVRRILNARAESMRERCDLLAIGHFHKFVSLPIYPERVHGIAGGTFQVKRSEFANRIGNGWDIGGVIVSYTVGAKGRVTEISAEFVEARPTLLMATG